MTRTAHYVASTHWDREWLEPFQGIRMRLVSLLDEVLDTFARGADFPAFVMDGQAVPILDYLEIRPERRAQVERYAREGRLKIGPWYVLPDEWLVSGESLVRNLQEGMRVAGELGAQSSRAGFICDMFGDTGQLPQIFVQMGIPFAFLWRGTHEREHHGILIWEAPDGTAIPSYRFGFGGYCSYAFAVRRPYDQIVPFNLDEAVPSLVSHAIAEAARTPDGPILLFDGGDHMEIEPETPALIARANELLAPHGIEIVHSDLDRYMEEALRCATAPQAALYGELRETGRDPFTEDQQWLIPGVLSSRIHLKQQNAACEDELCLWAEPLTAFATVLGREYPDGFLRQAWRHLLENHPHDSICACSIDQVHKDMVYRFDQSLGISRGLTAQTLKALTIAAAPGDRPDGSLVISVFNPTAGELDEPVDMELPLTLEWPAFQEFFGFERKFSFRLRGADGEEIPFQLTGQFLEKKGSQRRRCKFPIEDNRNVARVTAPLKVPAFGYTTLVVEPAIGPVRHLGSLAAADNAIENEFLRAEAAPNGTITLTDIRAGKKFERLLTFEERADIGDGWYHGLAVNDHIYSSACCGADVALIADGPEKATLRITLSMRVPEEFDFHRMVRSERLAPLSITSDITLRRGCARLEVTTTVENTIRDHRIRALFPTGLAGETYLSDAAYDVVERPIALAEDNALRRELDVETRPQQTWTAFGDGVHGLSVVSRGLPESAVMNRADRAIALTLLRGFRKAAFSNDNPGGQIIGTHTFRYDIVPFSGPAPVMELFQLGQRVNGPVRVCALAPHELGDAAKPPRMPRAHSFLDVRGNAVVTSVQRSEGKLLVRCFNPLQTTETARIRPAGGAGKATCIHLNGDIDTISNATVRNGTAEVSIPPKRIATVVME